MQACMTCVQTTAGAGSLPARQAPKRQLSTCLPHAVWRCSLPHIQLEAPRYIYPTLFGWTHTILHTDTPRRAARNHDRKLSRC